MQVLQRKTAPSAENIPFQARRIIRDLESQIKKHQCLLKQAGLSPYIGCQHENGFDHHILDHEISDIFLNHIIKNTPFLSLYALAQLRKKFIKKTRLNLFQQPELLQQIKKDIDQLQKDDCHRIIRWLQENHSDPSKLKIPKIIRIQVTPNIAISQAYPLFKNVHVFENLNLLHAVLAYLDQVEIPKKLIGHTISETWSRQYTVGYQMTNDNSVYSHKINHRRGLGFISTLRFPCSYFSVESYRSADDRIIFNAKSQTIINQFLV